MAPRPTTHRLSRRCEGVKLDEQSRRAEWVITAVYSLVLGIASGAVLNIFTPRRWALQRSVSAFDALLLRAQAADLPVSLTLSTGKVYIGIIVSTPDPTREPVVVSLVPMFSGFRDTEGDMTLTTGVVHPAPAFHSVILSSGVVVRPS